MKIDPHIFASYNEILDSVKLCGIKVYHRKLKGGIAGCFDGDKCITTVDSKLKYTIEGCNTLLHEKKHYFQWREGKYKEFFNGFKDGYNEHNLNIVIKAEMEAIEYAHKELKKYGINFEAAELTKAGFDLSVIFWKKHYFGTIE